MRWLWLMPVAVLCACGGGPIGPDEARRAISFEHGVELRLRVDAGGAGDQIHRGDLLRAAWAQILAPSLMLDVYDLLAQRALESPADSFETGVSWEDSDLGTALVVTRMNRLDLELKWCEVGSSEGQNAWRVELVRQGGVLVRETSVESAGGSWSGEIEIGNVGSLFRDGNTVIVVGVCYRVTEAETELTFRTFERRSALENGEPPRDGVHTVIQRGMNGEIVADRIGGRVIGDRFSNPNFIEWIAPVRARWSDAGGAAVQEGLGMPGEFPIRLEECWGPRLVTTYFSANRTTRTPAIGDPSSCIVQLP